eukprot:CAMPEP_0119525180 /NCGR_PEP_ID=MMETSP1344-20130328/40026_1 /TAXON_ID=236787 /ORGANISM="Florenciella parvula, Strain CCMP2471" /LENGTH=95 /DNA_ID=CAMNT_0007563893 /DNA_START=158 /DNA_END=446 /DNA_ORIENTATION=+
MSAIGVEHIFKSSVVPSSQFLKSKLRRDVYHLVPKKEVVRVGVLALFSNDLGMAVLANRHQSVVFLCLLPFLELHHISGAVDEPRYERELWIARF